MINSKILNGNDNQENKVQKQRQGTQKII